MTITTLPNDMIRMAKGDWHLDCPRADLPKWHKFLTDLRDRPHPRFGGKAFEKYYRDDVTAIEAAMKGVV